MPVKPEYEHLSQRLTHKIITAMSESGVTKIQLARLTGVQPSVVTRWLKGNHNFCMRTLIKIEEALGINLFIITKRTQDNQQFCFKCIYQGFKLVEDTVIISGEYFKMSEVGYRIRKELQRQELSINIFRGMMHISSTEVARWLNGQYKFNYHTLARIGHVLNLDITLKQDISN